MVESVAACIKKYFALPSRHVVYHLAEGEAVHLNLPRDGLYHLLGLQYLRHIPLLQNTKAKLPILKKISRGEILQQQIASGCSYAENVEDRVTYFDDFHRFFEDGQCKELVRFNPKAVSRTPGGSQIEADYMLYLALNENEKEYLHLFLRVNPADGNAYPCSFFYRANNDFLKGQRKRIPIEKVELL